VPQPNRYRLTSVRDNRRRKRRQKHHDSLYRLRSLRSQRFPRHQPISSRSPLVGRGVTYYNFTSDQFTGFHSIVIPGTLRDSLYLLEGLLEQQTSLRPTEVMTDTHGYESTGR
jgi:TnpA family transposase